MEFETYVLEALNCFVIPLCKELVSMITSHFYFFLKNICIGTPEKSKFSRN